MQAQRKATACCSVSHSDDFIAYVLYLLVTGTVTNCSIVTQIGLFEKEKVSFTPHENQDLPCKLNSIICSSYQCNDYKFRSAPYM